jgi:nicotinamidase-related amidase
MKYADNCILKKSGTILVIVDIQEKLASVMNKREQVVRNCLHLIQAAKLLSIPVILTEQYPKGLGPTVSEIKDALPSVEPFIKIAFDCCSQEGFSEMITSSHKKQVLLFGMETHICVLQTCLGLLVKGLTVHVVDDAVCSRKKADFRTGIEMMRSAGAVITSTETALFQLLEKAGTDEFREISKRIK